MAKPGAIFALQSNFLFKDKEAEEIYKELFTRFIIRLQKYKFSVLEDTEDCAVREGESKGFKQLIFVKLYKIDGSKEMFSSGPTAAINIPAGYRRPTAIEDYFALQKAHILLGQTRLYLIDSFEEIYKHVDIAS